MIIRETIVTRSHERPQSLFGAVHRLRRAGRRLAIAVWAALAGIGVSGCSGSQSHLRLLEADNALSVAPANSPTHDFVVSIRNVKDIGYDPDDKATRDRTAVQAMQAQCPSARVVGETVITTGTYLLGNPARTYAIQIKCT